MKEIDYKKLAEERLRQLLNMDKLVSRFQDERYALQESIDNGIRCYSDKKCIADGIVIFYKDDLKNNATLILDDGIEL
jgi:hypothetical protein